MNRVALWVLVIALLGTVACGQVDESAPETTPETVSDEAQLQDPGIDASDSLDRDPATVSYDDELRSILRQLRILQDEINAVVHSDTLMAHEIVPPVRDRFRPALAGLLHRSRQLQPDAGYESVHQQLLAFLELWIEAYDLLLQGVRERDNQMLLEFSAKQEQASRLGALLEANIHIVRARTE